MEALTAFQQVMDANMGPKYTDEHQKNVQKWIHDGTFKAQQSVTQGIDNVRILIGKILQTV